MRSSWLAFLVVGLVVGALYAGLAVLGPGSLALMSASQHAADGVPAMINHQGVVAVNGVRFSGTGQFRFAIVDGSGTMQWSNSDDGNSDGIPDSAVPLTVADGIYSILLGDVALTNMDNGVPASIFSDAGLKLRIWFSDGLNGVQQLTPDQRLVTAPYAFTVADGAITSGKIADGAVTADKLAADVYNSSHSMFIARQAIINGNFVINQRAHTSNAVLPAGTYGHDRWKAGAAGGDYTFTQNEYSTQVTIKPGKSLIQIVEDKNVVAGTYTLSWAGTAQARFGINSGAPSGAYASSPVTITTQTPGNVMSVEFGEGTLGEVNLSVGTTALPFLPRSHADETRACQRYFYRFVATTWNYLALSGNVGSWHVANFSVPVPFRAMPTVTQSGLALRTTGGGWTTITDWGVQYVLGSTNVVFTSYHDVAANRYLQWVSGGGHLTFDAEL